VFKIGGGGGGGGSTVSVLLNSDTKTEVGSGIFLALAWRLKCSRMLVPTSTQVFLGFPVPKSKC